MIFLNAIFILTLCQLGTSTTIIAVDTSKVLSKVDPRFLSVAIGTHVVAERWNRFDFNHPRVLNMAKALSPAYFRLGGTSADLTIFEEKPKRNSPLNTTTELNTNYSENCFQTNNAEGGNICEDLSLKLYKPKKNITLSGLDWINLNEFAEKVNWTFLFDINVSVVPFISI